MTTSIQNPFPLRDPYTASSLLQKAIRRGEAELALEAAYLLLRQRGRNVWRRLLIVAFEDVGLGNPEAVRATLEVAEAHLNRGTIRLSDGLEDVVAALSASIKSRATDHLACSAARLSASRSLVQRNQFDDMGVLLDLVGDPGRPLVERAAALMDCQGRSKLAAELLFAKRMTALGGLLPSEGAQLVELCLRAHRLLHGSFVLTLPLLQAEIIENDHRPTVIADEAPEPEWIGRLPSYVFDKHTAVGKKALGRFARENATVASVLDRFVAASSRIDTVCMAAFYVDAVPLDRQLVWPGSEELERAGFHSDMHKAGCPPCAIDPVLAAVAGNLDHLNALRVELSGWRAD